MPITPLLGQLEILFLPALLIGRVCFGVFRLADWRADLTAQRGLSRYCHARLFRNYSRRLQQYRADYERRVRLEKYSRIYESILSWGWAVFTIFFIKRLVDSSYGRLVSDTRK